VGYYCNWTKRSQISFTVSINLKYIDEHFYTEFSFKTFHFWNNKIVQPKLIALPKYAAKFASLNASEHV